MPRLSHQLTNRLEHYPKLLVILRPVNLVLKLKDSIGLRSEDIGKKSVRVDEKTWNTLVSLSLYTMKAKVDPYPLQAHLTSGHLLDYDPKTGRYLKTEAFDLLQRVIQRAHLLTKSDEASFVDLIKHGTAIDKHAARAVPAHLLLTWMGRLLSWADFIQSAKSLARLLSGKPSTRTSEIPITPIVDQEAQLAAEAVSLEQVRAFVNE